MGFDLPIDTTIGGQDIFHGGNHDDRGIPHSQFVEKAPRYNFSTTATNEGQNKYVKIGTIAHLINNNVTLLYRLDFFEISQSRHHVLDVAISSGTNGSNVTLKHNGERDIEFHAIVSTVINSDNTKTQTIDIYAKCVYNWRTYFYRVNFARASNYYDYDEDYALRSIQLIDGTTFLTTLTPTVSEIVTRPLKTMRVSSNATTTISPGGQVVIYLTITDLLATSNVAITASSDVPVNFSFTPCYSSYQTLKVTIRNNSAVDTVAFPAMTWNVMYS